MGHGTVKAIKDVLPDAEVILDVTTPESELPHPNTMDFIGYKNGKEVSKIRIMSIGGGRLSIIDHPNKEMVFYREDSISSAKPAFSLTIFLIMKLQKLLKLDSFRHSLLQ